MEDEFDNFEDHYNYYKNNNDNEDDQSANQTNDNGKDKDKQTNKWTPNQWLSLGSGLSGIAANIIGATRKPAPVTNNYNGASEDELNNMVTTIVGGISAAIVVIGLVGFGIYKLSKKD